MTDDEILAEVEQMRLAGNRGESPTLEGTPEGTYLWKVAHQEPEFFMVGSSPTIRIVTSYQVTGVAGNVSTRADLSVGASLIPA